MAGDYAACGLAADLRPLTDVERAEMDEHHAAMHGRFGEDFRPFRLRIVTLQGEEQVLDGPEHAANDDVGTLCGIPPDAYFVMRHHFSPRDERNCAACRDAAE